MNTLDNPAGLERRLEYAKEQAANSQDPFWYDEVRALEFDLAYLHSQFETAPPAPEEQPAPPGLDHNQCANLIHHAFLTHKLSLPRVRYLLEQIGMQGKDLEAHLDGLSKVRQCRNKTWDAQDHAPYWVRHLGQLAKLVMNGTVRAFDALRQVDPNDEYPDVVGALIAYLQERRDRTDGLAARLILEPRFLEDGIEYCRKCGRARAPKQLSTRGICAACQVNIACSVESNLINRSGPYYRKWLAGLGKAARRLEDELSPKGDK